MKPPEIFSFADSRWLLLTERRRSNVPSSVLSGAQMKKSWRWRAEAEAVVDMYRDSGRLRRARRTISVPSTAQSGDDPERIHRTEVAQSAETCATSPVLIPLGWILHHKLPILLSGFSVLLASPSIPPTHPALKSLSQR
jgi:hypothetical protein